MMYFKNSLLYKVQILLPRHAGFINLNPGDVVEGEYFARYPYLKPVELAMGMKVRFSQSRFEGSLVEKLSSVARLKPVADSLKQSLGVQEPIPALPEPEETTEESEQLSESSETTTDQTEAKEEGTEVSSEVTEPVVGAVAKKKLPKKKAKKEEE